MKRYGDIFEKIYDLDNLRLAHKRARRDKSFYKEVRMVDNNEEYYLRQIQEMLQQKTYRVCEHDYKMFRKNDKGKVREIHKLDYFPHRIIQHALLIQIEGLLVRSFVRDTFASIPGRGIHDAFMRLDKTLRCHPAGTQYCLKFDIKKFYPSIDHEVLKRQFRQKFKDPDLLWLIDTIIDSLGGKKGIAIGSLFSQWAGNFNLSQFDHWMKEQKQVKFYYRYMDDIVILHSDKQYLHDLLRDAKQYLHEELRLEVKENHKVFPVDKQGIDFVGYRHFRRYVLLRKSTAKNLIRKMRRLNTKLNAGGQMTYSEFCCINSYKGWLEWCNGYNLYKKWIESLKPYCEQYYQEAIRGETDLKLGYNNKLSAWSGGDLK